MLISRFFRKPSSYRCYRYIQQSTGVINHINIQGYGVAVIDGHFHKEIKYGIPNQTLQFDHSKGRKHRKHKYKVTSVIKQSDDIENPKCPLYGICGGCRFQNLKYEKQLEYKQQIVKEQISKLKKVCKIKPIIKADQLFEYRSKIEFSCMNKLYNIPNTLSPHINNSLYTSDYIENYNKLNSKLPLGMNPSREQHSIGSIIAINSCLLYDSIGNEIMNFIKTQCEDLNVNPFDNFTKTGELVSIGLKFGNLLNDTTKQKQLQIMIIFKILSNNEIDMKIKNITNRIISKYKETDKFKIVSIISINKNSSKSHELINDSDNENIHLYYGKTFLFHTINSKIYKISANAFLQPNLYQTDKLYDEIEKGLNLTENSIVWDLFCGMGSIGINIANKVKSVYGFELIQNAIEDAKINMTLNNITNCHFFTMNLQQPETLLSNYPHPDILIVDPNRPGLHPNLIKFISQIKPKQFCYVSCNILTQILDLNQFLLMNPEYEISYSQPVDMLPHTQHIENIIFLNKSK